VIAKQDVENIWIDAKIHSKTKKIKVKVARSRVKSVSNRSLLLSGERDIYQNYDLVVGLPLMMNHLLPVVVLTGGGDG